MTTGRATGASFRSGCSRSCGTVTVPQRTQDVSILLAARMCDGHWPGTKTGSPLCDCLEMKPIADVANDAITHARPIAPSRYSAALILPPSTPRSHRASPPSERPMRTSVSMDDRWGRQARSIGPRAHACLTFDHGRLTTRRGYLLPLRPGPAALWCSRRQYGLDLVEADGLQQVMIEAGSRDLRLEIGVVTARHRNENDAVETGLGTQEPGDRESVIRPVETDVEEYDRRLKFDRDLDDAIRRIRGRDDMTGNAQQLRDCLRRGHVIIDDENP